MLCFVLRSPLVVLNCPSMVYRNGAERRANSIPGSSGGARPLVHKGFTARSRLVLICAHLIKLGAPNRSFSGKLDLLLPSVNLHAEDSGGAGWCSITHSDQSCSTIRVSSVMAL